MEIEKMQSSERSRKMSFKLGDLLGKEALACCVPGGGVAYELGKILVHNMIDYYNDRAKRRIEKFCNTIVGGEDPLNIDSESLNKELNVEDFHAVLSSCVKDMEDEKTEIYSTLMLSLMNSTVSFDERRHMIQACSQLTYKEISLLKVMYISSKYDFMTVGSTQKQLEDIFTTTDPYNLLYIDSLKRLGFVDISRKKVTFMGERFVTSVFEDKSLIPEAIGRKQCCKGSALIISYQLADQSHRKIYDYVSGILYENNIKSNTHIIDDRNIRSGIHMHYSLAFLVQSQNCIEEHYVDSLAKLSNKIPVVSINIKGERYRCSLGGVNFSHEIYMQKNGNEYDYSALTKQIINIIRLYY